MIDSMDLSNPDFFKRKAREWRQIQKRLADQILFPIQTARFKRKTEIAEFVCSKSTWKDQTLTATFRQPFDILALTNRTWQRKKAAGPSSDLCPVWRSHTGQSSQLFPVATGRNAQCLATVASDARLTASTVSDSDPQIMKIIQDICVICG
jgi:hypothetical protein